uniref:Uncharacterized protein n=1 Tax=Opuntia streptacantha TaxID=393608 RepID=A0A7C9EZZ6_OPUST
MYVSVYQQDDVHDWLKQSTIFVAAGSSKKLNSARQPAANLRPPSQPIAVATAIAHPLLFVPGSLVHTALRSPSTMLTHPPAASVDTVAIITRRRLPSLALARLGRS